MSLQPHKTGKYLLLFEIMLNYFWNLPHAPSTLESFSPAMVLYYSIHYVICFSTIALLSQVPPFLWATPRTAWLSEVEIGM